MNAYRSTDAVQGQLSDERATRLNETFPNPLYPLLRELRLR